MNFFYFFSQFTHLIFKKIKKTYKVQNILLFFHLLLEDVLTGDFNLQFIL